MQLHHVIISHQGYIMLTINLFTWKTKFWRLVPWLAMLRQWQTVNTDLDWHWKHSDVVCQIALNGITKLESVGSLAVVARAWTMWDKLHSSDCTCNGLYNSLHVPFSAQVRINPLLFIPPGYITNNSELSWLEQIYVHVPFTWLASHSCIIIMISRAKVIVSNPIMSTVHKPCLRSTTQ